MLNIRCSWTHLALLLLSLPGIGISIYLTGVHYNSAKLVCDNVGLINCERVLGSSFSVVSGTQIPLSIPGLVWFVVTGALAIFGLFRPDQRLIRQGELLWTGLGMLTVFYLLYVEIVRLDAFCLWCTFLHIIIFSMFLMTIVNLLNLSEEEDEPEVEEEEEPQLSGSGKRRKTRQEVRL